MCYIGYCDALGALIMRAHLNGELEGINGKKC